MIARPVSRPVSRGVSRRVNEFSGGGWTPPSSLKFFDFTKNRYSEEGSQKTFVEMDSDFIRLSSATNWQGGQLVEVANDVPRISGEGLLIESQATNAVLDNTFTSATVNQPTRVSLSDVEDSTIPNAKLLTSKVGWSTRSGGLTTLQAQGDYPLGITSPTLQDGYHRSCIVKNSSGARYASLYFSDMTGSGAVIDFVEGVYVGTAAGSMRNLGGGWWELRLWSGSDSPVHEKQFRVAFGNTLTGTNLVTEIGDSVFVAYPSAYDDKDIDLSIIPTYGTAVTRSPDILNIPLLPTQTITGDWDTGVTYTVADNIATFTGHGYIRDITVEAL